MRAAQGQANTAEQAAGKMAGQYQSAAQADEQQLTPTYQRWLNAQHGLTPEQLNETLTYAGAGTGGATGALKSNAEMEAARTHNSAALPGLEDSLARSAQQTMAKTSEGVANQDVQAAKQENAMGAEGLSNLFGVNTDAALKSMQVQNQDINTEVEAGKSGWFQNLTGLITAGADAYGAIMGKPGGGH